MGSIAEDVRALADPAYRDFQSALIPTVEPSRVLGVRIPVLRSYARRLVRERPDEVRAFLAHPAHRFYDEMNLHGLLIGLVCQTPQQAFELLDAFLPHVDNWATCDLIRVPAFEKDLDAVYEKICSWVTSGPEYMVRFGIVQLIYRFSGDAFETAHLDLIAGIERPERSINLARAWYFSVALAEHYEQALPLFETPTLDAWTHDAALQKARESRRIAPERKAYLQTLKLKGRRGGAR